MDMRKELSAVARMVRATKASEEMPALGSATEKVNASDLPSPALQLGQSITDFELPDASGTMVKSVDLRANGPVLIVFYCGYWCPLCRLTLQTLDGRYAEFQDRGVTLVGISAHTSPQAANQSLTTQKKYRLKFPVLYDMGNRVASQFGIVFTLDEALEEGQEVLGFDVTADSEDNSFLLPVPSIFLIGRDGTILSSFVEVDYLTRLAAENAHSWFD